MNCYTGALFLLACYLAGNWFMDWLLPNPYSEKLVIIKSSTQVNIITSGETS